MTEKNASAIPDSKRNKRLSEKNDKITRLKNKAKTNSNKCPCTLQKKTDDSKPQNLLALENIPVESTCAVFFAQEKNTDNTYSSESSEEKGLQLEQELFLKICDDVALFGQKTLLILSSKANAQYGGDLRSVLRKKLAHTVFITGQTTENTQETIDKTQSTGDFTPQIADETQQPVRDVTEISPNTEQAADNTGEWTANSTSLLNEIDSSFNESDSSFNEVGISCNENNDSCSEIGSSCNEIDNLHSENNNSNNEIRSSYNKHHGSCNEIGSSFNKDLSSYNEPCRSLLKTANIQDESNESFTDIFLQEGDFIRAKNLLSENDDVRSILVCGGQSEINLAKRLSTLYQLPLLAVWTQPDCDDVLSPFCTAFNQGKASREPSVIPNSLYVNLTAPLSSLEMRCGTGFIAKALITLFEMDYLGDTSPHENILSIVKNCLFTRLDIPEINNKRLLYSSLLSLSAIKTHSCTNHGGIDGLMDTLSTIGINPSRYAYACSRIITDIYKAALESCELEICLPPDPFMRSVSLKTAKIAEITSLITTPLHDLHFPRISDKIMRLDKSLSLFESSCNLSRLPISSRKLRNAINNSVCIYQGSSFLKDLYLSGFLGR